VVPVFHIFVIKYSLVLSVANILLQLLHLVWIPHVHLGEHVNTATELGTMGCLSLFMALVYEKLRREEGEGSGLNSNSNFRMRWGTVHW
jgi:hypothetical protein